MNITLQVGSKDDSLAMAHTDQVKKKFRGLKPDKLNEKLYELYLAGEQNLVFAVNSQIAVKEGNENAPEVLALIAALESKAVADFIAEKYAGAVVSTIENPGDGYDATVDYEALKDVTITVAASPTPHAEILEVATSPS